jgi:hypothetical protein
VEIDVVPAVPGGKLWAIEIKRSSASILAKSQKTANYSEADCIAYAGMATFIDSAGSRNNNMSKLA